MKDLYLLAGQSNMSGRGNLSEVPTFTNASRITMFANDWTWKAASEPVDSAFNQQLSVSLDNPVGAGPSMAFADRMVTLRNNDVGLIPCSKGSSSIQDWNPSYSYWSLYGGGVAAAKEALKQSGTVFKGVIFWQGESDTYNTSLLNAWPRNMWLFINGLRQDFNNPTLPIVFAQLSKNPTTRAAEFPQWAALKNLQWGFRDPSIKMITTEDLPVQSDELHCTTAGAVTAGIRFADAMHALLG